LGYKKNVEYGKRLGWVKESERGKGRHRGRDIREETEGGKETAEKTERKRGR
jgi:hypothetical protein